MHCICILSHIFSGRTKCHIKKKLSARIENLQRKECFIEQKSLMNFIKSRPCGYVNTHAHLPNSWPLALITHFHGPQKSLLKIDPLSAISIVVSKTTNQILNTHTRDYFGVALGSWWTRYLPFYCFLNHLIIKCHSKVVNTGAVWSYFLVVCWSSFKQWWLIKLNCNL